MLRWFFLFMVEMWTVFTKKSLYKQNGEISGGENPQKMIGNL